MDVRETTLSNLRQNLFFVPREKGSTLKENILLPKYINI